MDAAIVQYLNQSYSQGRPVIDGEVLLAGLLFFQPQYGKLGGQELARSWRALKGWKKASSDQVETTTAKNDLVWGLLGNGQKQEAFDGHPRLDDDRYVLPTQRTLAVKARGLDQTNAGCGKRLVIAPPPCATRRAEQNTELRQHNRPEKPKLSVDHQKWLQSWRPASPQKGFFEYRYEDFTKEFRRATRALGMTDLVPYQCRHSGASLDKAGLHPHHAGDQKNGEG